MTTARERIEQILASHGCMDRWGDSAGERAELEPYKQRMLNELMAVVDDAYKLGAGVQAALNAAIEKQGDPRFDVPPDFSDVPTMSSHQYGNRLMTHIRQELTDELTNEPVSEYPPDNGALQ